MEVAAAGKAGGDLFSSRLPTRYRKGALSVVSTHDAATPINDADVIPVLTCDVWEHAYYIDYRQDRAGWLATWWDKLVNWEFAGRQYNASLGEAEAWHFPHPLR